VLLSGLQLLRQFTDVVMLLGLLVCGFVVFAPKFVESQFGITAAWAAQLIGMLSLYNSFVSSLFFCTGRYSNTDLVMLELLLLHG